MEEWAGVMGSAISGVDGIPGSNMMLPELDISPKVKFAYNEPVALPAPNCSDPSKVNITACVNGTLNCSDPTYADSVECVVAAQHAESGAVVGNASNATNATTNASMPGTDAPTPSLGVLGRAASFPGRASIVLPGPAAAAVYAEAPFSVTLWARTRRAPHGDGEQVLFSAGRHQECEGVASRICEAQRPAGGNYGAELAAARDGRVVARLAVRAGQHGTARVDVLAVHARGNTGLSEDAWTHVALTVGAGRARLWVNGSLAGDEPLAPRAYAPLPAGGRPGDPPPPARIGCDAGQLHGRSAWARCLAGAVDEVALFAAALPPARVRAHFVATMATPDTMQPHIGCTECGPRPRPRPAPRSGGLTHRRCRRPPQAHTNPVQSCAAAQLGAKRMHARGNVATAEAASPARAEEAAALDEGAGTAALYGPGAWPINPARAE
jgi:hypothetical protein